MTVAPRLRYFVAGTDTDVGKTFVSCALLHAAAAAGYSTLGMKPLAAGAQATAAGLRNSDAQQLQAASSVELAYEQLNPVCLPEPASPHIAAALAGRRVTVERLAGFCRGVLTLRANLTLIEGAGGWRVPLNEREYLSDLARALQLPVLLVVGMRLGCLNHALLTAEALVRDGLVLGGWVANRIDPGMQHYEDNRNSLSERLGMPPLAELPWFGAEARPAQAASLVALDQLFAASE
jgi:dethiobiotin synthetase